MIVLDWFQYSCVFLNNNFKRILVKDYWHINTSKAFYEFKNEFFLFFAILYNGVSFVLNEFFSNRNINNKGSIIQWIFQIRKDGIINNFSRVWLKKKEINDQICIIDVVRITSGNLFVRIVNDELGLILFSFFYVFLFYFEFLFLYLDIGEEDKMWHHMSRSHKSHAHVTQWNNIESSKNDDII